MSVLFYCPKDDNKKINECSFNLFITVEGSLLFPNYDQENISSSHSVRHCFFISEQMYGLIWLTDLRSKMDSIDLLIMLTSAVCHDLDHTGYNNAYQVYMRFPHCASADSVYLLSHNTKQEFGSNKTILEGTRFVLGLVNPHFNLN